MRGEMECYWDCKISSSAAGSGQLVSNLACLSDCFPSGSCLAALVRDTVGSGVCDLTDQWGYNPAPAIYPMAECELGPATGQEEEGSSYGGSDVILRGTCSSETERLLDTAECEAEMYSQPAFITNTLTQLVLYSCNHQVAQRYVVFQQAALARRRRSADSQDAAAALVVRRKRLAPLHAVYGERNISTRLEFSHTRGRYPWLCSLQTRGEHFCSATLLSVPPGPTVLVGAAHCTLLCWDEEGGRPVPACCCSGECRDRDGLCGLRPVLRDLQPGQVVALCGAWRAGPGLRDRGPREVRLRVKSFTRHPDYNSTAGPLAGADIAIFKVADRGEK